MAIKKQSRGSELGSVGLAETQVLFCLAGLTLVPLYDSAGIKRVFV